MSSKIVLITGCSSGFGKGMVKEFLEKGWTVIATMRNSSQRSDLFKEEIQAYPERLVSAELDVTVPADRAAVLTLIEQKFSGRLDALVNNAGFGLFGIFEELSEKQIRDQMEVNFFGVLLLTQSLLPVLRKNKGVIFNFSSILGIVTLPVASLYCASKFAIEGWSESLHYELLPHGVRVVLVEPGSFKTSFNQNIQGAGAELSHPDYAVQVQKYASLREKVGKSRGAGDPQTLIKRVVRLAQSRANPVRVVFGVDAITADFAQRILPRRLWSGILSMSYRRLFQHSR